MQRANPSLRFGGELYFGESAPYCLPEGEYRLDWSAETREIEFLEEGWSITAVLEAGVPWSDAGKEDVSVVESDNERYDGMDWEVFRQIWQDIKGSEHSSVDNYYHN